MCSFFLTEFLKAVVLVLCQKREHLAVYGVRTILLFLSVIFISEPPNPVHNCTVSEETENSFRITCTEGKDGGLSQYFFMEIRDMASNVLQQNVSAQTADFTARGLYAGSTYTVSIFSSNARGRSKPVVIQVSTAASPESQTRQGRFIIVRNID
ncbi:UNVERIFIED_CONTAM: hypothetical protein NCL1_18478 [Trichonephila clavipes]